ncbi:uncharacterized protein [Atheta coriaria]|uniref:uncharacterized protein n=1 Tax=Dalotia coriaria TaxID=877792 RepID=UPI0031F418CF
MVVLSKLQLLCDFPFIKSCRPLHFSGHQHCSANAIMCFLNAARACTKYYVPVYILQLALVGAKNLNQEKFLEIFLGYLRSVIYGGVFPMAASGTLCLYLTLFGRIDVKTLLTIGVMVGVTIFCETKRNRRLNSYMISTLALEVMVNELEAKNLITRSPLRDTLKFMAINGLVMYFLARKKLKSLNFWFYDIKPIKEKAPDDNVENIQKCTHQDNCTNFLKEGFKKYFFIGYGWNLIKIIMKKSALMIKKPKLIPSFIVKLENLKFGAVLGLYAVIYRYIMCNLVKIDSVQSAQRRAVHSGLAGVLAGSTYIIEPNLQFGLTALVTLLQIFYENLKETTFNENFWEKVPGAELCFIVMVSYLNICYIANTVDMQRANIKFIYDTFSGNIASKFRTVILREMKLIQ